MTLAEWSNRNKTPEQQAADDRSFPPKKTGPTWVMLPIAEKISYSAMKKSTVVSIWYSRYSPPFRYLTRPNKKKRVRDQSSSI